MKKRILLVVLMFLLVFSMIPSVFAEGETGDSADPTVTEEPADPTVTEEPADPTVTEEPAESPVPSEEPEVSLPDPVSEPIEGPSISSQAVGSARPDISDYLSKKSGLSDAQSKLSTKLLQLTDSEYLPAGVKQSQLIEQMVSDKQIKGEAAISSKGDLSATDVYVYIKVKEGCDPSAVKPYVTELVSVNEETNLCVAWVNVTSMKSLSSLYEVENICEVTPPVVCSGSKLSEGDSMLEANDVRNLLGANGTGVKVGVISDGVDHWANSKASGDLPASFGSSNILGNAVGGDEGTAMLEIVYDLAPGATLYFHDCGSNWDQFMAAIDELANAGCNVICDDILWTTVPFFEDGDIAKHIKSMLASRNILYVTSAGNQGDSHFQGKFYNDGDDFMDFSRGTSDYPDLYVRVPAGGVVQVVMEWDDPFYNARNDYDLWLYNYLTGDVLDFSWNPQYTTGNSPLELTYWYNNTGSTVIAAVTASAYYEEGESLPKVKTMELYIYTNGLVYSDNIVSRDSIFGHAAVPGVLAAGAIDGNAGDGSDYGLIEYFSSRGPVTMRGGEVRNKPDICGIDGVSVTGAGGFPDPFYGTSAASPHIAAVAALLMDRFDNLKTAAQVRQIILDNRDDMGTAGFDYDYGWGRSDAYAAATSSNYVTFNTQGGSAAPGRQLIVRNGKATAPASPTKAPYYFEGWYTSTDFAPAHKWIFASNTVAADTTLYANWVRKYTISATPNSSKYGTVSGAGVFVDPAPYDGESVTLRATAKSGYRFVNWTEGTTVVSANSVYTFTALNNRTLKANFVKIGTAVISSITSPTYNTVSLSWGAVDGATGYWVYRATSSRGTYTKISGDITGTTSFNDTVPKWGKTYYYKVRVYCTATTGTTYGSYSSYKSVKPNWGTPVLAAARLNYHSVKLDWNSVADADSYNVYRSTKSSGTYTLIKEGVHALTYTVEMAASDINKTYYYKVRPVDEHGGAQGLGPYSKYKSAKASWQTLTLTAASRSYQSIRLSWTAVEDADYYIIYRNTKSYGTFTIVPGGEKVEDLYYIDNGLTKGIKYYYKVKPVDEDQPADIGNSAPLSGYKFAKPAWPALGLTAVSSGSNSVELNWNDITDADLYQVYYATSAYGTYTKFGGTIGVSYATVTGLTTGKTYYFKIEAIDSDKGVTYMYSTYKSAKPVPLVPLDLK